MAPNGFHEYEAESDNRDVASGDETETDLEAGCSKLRANGLVWTEGVDDRVGSDDWKPFVPVSQGEAIVTDLPWAVERYFVTFGRSAGGVTCSFSANFDTATTGVRLRPYVGAEGKTAEEALRKACEAAPIERREQ